MLAGSVYNVIPDVARIPETQGATYYPRQFATPAEAYDNELDNYRQDNTVFPRESKPAITPLPHVLFKAQDDAERLHKAIEGIGTDEDTIIRILTKRSLEQRMQIAESYKTMFGFVLSYHLVLETSGKFRDVLNALLTPLPLYYAKELRSAIIGLGTSESDLIEIICTLTNHDIRRVKKTYKAVFKSKLEDDIRGDTSDQFQELLLTLLKGNRSEELVVHPKKAKIDAKRLAYASEHNKKSDEVYLHMLTSQSLAQLAAVIREFKTLTTHDLEDFIWAEFSGDVRRALFAIVEIARDGYAMFFAKRLHQAMQGLGTNDQQLIRIIVTRSEIDLHDIAFAFRKLYKEKLATWIEDDCFGYYATCLLSILGAKEFEESDIDTVTLDHELTDTEH